MQTIDVPVIPVDKLSQITGHLRYNTLIGESCGSRMHLATLSSGQPVAIKKFCRKGSDDSDSDFYVQVYSKLKNEHVLQLLGHCLYGNCTILVFPYATLGSLHDILHGKEDLDVKPRPILSWNQRVKIAYGAARGLEYIHQICQPPIIHKNVKSRNVIIFEDYVSKIADIRSEAEMERRRYDEKVDLSIYAYAPPASENVTAGRYTNKGDVYGFGVILLELLTGRMPIMPLDMTKEFGHHILVKWATPLLSKDKVKKCVDPKLGDDYLLNAVAKMAALAANCLELKSEDRPDMTHVVEALQSISTEQP